MEAMEVEVETNSEGREDVELVWDDWGHLRDVIDIIAKNKNEAANSV